MTCVIIGSGPAGVCSAEAIRSRLPDEPVIMVSKDSAPAGSPVMLTYWLTGKYDPRRLYFRDDDWAEKNCITLKTGVEAVSLDPTANRIFLDSKESLQYDRLLIASGTSATALPIPGGDSRGVGFFRHLYDAQAFLKDETGVEQVVIIGAGFIGLKLACHLSEKGVGVTLLEKEPRLAARIFDEATSRRVEETLRHHGINVETCVEASEILHHKGRVKGIRLKDDRSFTCERVIQAVGVAPNVEFLRESGIRLQRGIVVNDRMQTNMAGIYAAGDVTITTDSITGEPFNNATWPAATRQGAVAGANMAGANRRYLQNFPVNALDLFSLRVMAAGHPLTDPGPDVEITVQERPHLYRKLVTRAGALIGFILAGDVTGAGVLLNALKSKKKIAGPLGDDTFSLQDSVPPNLGYRRGYIF
ncbi:MAG: FAD-dependent oxidoreductase [Desulfobacterales bacterium]|nr:FAD-dependent oxidoreductase [Desulfobacterales bacterium]